MVTKYSDITSDLMAHPVHGDLVFKTNLNSIKESIRNLLMTDKYERLHQPDVGSDIRGLLFDLASPVTAELLRTNIETTISNYERRVKILNLSVTIDSIGHSYNVSLLFAVINSGEQGAMEITLDRVR